MCTTDVYTDVYPDGRRREYQEPNYCSAASQSGRFCANHVIYNHPPRSVAYPLPVPTHPSPGPSYPISQQTPSTPPLGSPHSTSSGAYADYNHVESSSSNGERRHSGIYVNGQKVLDLNRKNRSRAERIVVLDSLQGTSSGADADRIATANRPPRNEDIQIAIICSLPLEYDALTLVFDGHWIEKSSEYDTFKELRLKVKKGRVGNHSVVLCLLPSVGKATAAIAAASLRSIYTGLKFAILAGICGGVPSPGTDNEILMGDVVISNEVVQYYLGRKYPTEFLAKDTMRKSRGRLNKETHDILAIFHTNIGLSDLQNRTIEILAQLQQTAVDADHKTHYNRPAANEDMLFEPSYPHQHRDSPGCGCVAGSTCNEAMIASCKELQCDSRHQVSRKRLESEGKRQLGEEVNVTSTQKSRIHIGHIGSGDTVMKSGKQRDRVAREHGIIAFEMEGAGVWDEIRCILIKGVCDYADGHKSKIWQNFAAAMAASATKAFLEYYEQTGKPRTTRTQHLIPFRANMRFTGRSEILDHIRLAFSLVHNQQRPDGLSSKVVLYGRGGIGKTEIASAYVHWLRDAHPKVSVFWVNASNEHHLRRDYYSIAEAYDIPGRDDPQVNILSLVKTWLEREYRGQWLIVFDGLDQTDLFLSPQPGRIINDAHQVNPADFKFYIPEYRHGSILFTTRNEQIWVELAQEGSLLEVGEMDESEAQQLLQNVVGTETDAGNVAALCAQLGHEPFAITQAAAFISEKSISVDEYLERLDAITDSFMDRQGHGGVFVPEASASSGQLKDSHLPPHTPSTPTTSNTEQPPKLRKPEALTPRLLQSSPAKFNIRYKLVQMLYGEYTRLNNELKKTAKDAEEKQLILTDQDLIWRVLDEEEIVAVEKAAIYSNAIKNKIMQYKKMTLLQWMDERVVQHHQQTRKDSHNKKPLESPKKTETGLTPTQLRPHDSDEEDEQSFGDDTPIWKQRHWRTSETENSRSTASSDSESGSSFSIESQVFSGKLASTKLSSLEEETNQARHGEAGKQKVENFYSHTDTADDPPDNNDDIRSLISGSEDIQSQDGSASIRWAVKTAAVSYLAEVLTENPDLAPLYRDAAQRLEHYRFFRNHGRLLKRYYLSLRSQAPNQKQKTAIEFLRPRSHRALISRRVLEKLQSHDKTMRERVHATLPQDEERNLTLERYLNNVEPHSKSLPADDVETAPDVGEDESSMDEEDYHSISALVDLEETRSFFVSGIPLARFAAEFQDFLKPGCERVKETPRVGVVKPLDRPNLASWAAKCSAWLFDLWSPPKPGNQRVRYICECGDYMFLDVRELSPGGVGRFRERFARDGLASFVAAQDSTTDVSSGLSPPPPAYLRSERSQSTASSRSSELENSSSTTRSSTSSASSWSEESTPQEGPSTLQYLLVCINQKSLPILVNIECSSFENDQYLCQKILENYRMIREAATWKISFLLPLSIATMVSNVSKFLEEKTPSWLQWVSRLFRSVSEISFFKMDSGDFVRFQLVPVGEDTVPNHFKCGEFPPCSEVEAGNYLYEPVPMADVALASIPLWHLTRPGRRHSDKYWITTFPKKLRYPLRREAGVYGKPVIGWGIRVNECFNWNHFMFLIFTVFLLIGIIMGTYLALKGDDSSGFGLAAFLAAVAAIYIPHQYFAWKDKLD